MNSMVQIEVLGWRLEVDVETTHSFTRGLQFLGSPCDCAPCRNFQAALELLPRPLLELLSRLGTSADKPAEIYYCCPNPDGTHKYGGWYHVTGQILSGWNEPTELQFQGLGDRVSICFSSRQVHLVPEGFPHPVIQLEFLMDIPWVLNEEPPF